MERDAMPDIEFFDTDFDPTSIKKFHFEIMKVDSANVSFLSNFFMNNKNDYVFRDTNMSIYLFTQYGKNISSPADYIETSRNTNRQSNVLEQIHSKIDGVIHKRAEDGLVTMIDSVESMTQTQSQTQSQVVTINNSSNGCGECTSKEKLSEKDVEIATLNRVIDKISSQVNGIAVEVGAAEKNMQVLFDTFPPDMVREAFASCIVNSTTTEEMEAGMQYAKLFQDSDPVGDLVTCENLIIQAHKSIDAFHNFFSIATHPDSESGDDISPYESLQLDKHISGLIKAQLALKRFYKNKS